MNRKNFLSFKISAFLTLFCLLIFAPLCAMEKGKAERITTDKIKTMLLEAKYAIDKMDFDAAEAVYRGILQKNSQSASAICGIAEVLYWRNQFKESEKYIRQCLSINPEFSKAYLLQSLIHRIRQENDKWREFG